jgi:hypothetical protein
MESFMALFHEKALKPSARAILALVAALHRKGYLASANGIGKLLRGKSDQETTVFSSLDLFGYSSSVSSKRIKARIRTLLRAGYLAQKYVEGQDEYYFLVTAKGAGQPAFRPKKKKVTKTEKKNFIAAQGEHA